MGAKHSVQGNVAQQRPRANSVIEAADLRPAGPIRQTASHGPTRHHSVAVDSHFSDDTEPDEEEPQPGPSNRSLSTGTTSNLVSSFRWTSRSPRTTFHFNTTTSPNRGTSARNAALDRRNNHILRFFSGQDIDCPVCHKQVPSDDAEAHLVMCLTRPKLAYNEEILTSNRGECVICFEDLEPGQTAARLECLCLYHKDCIDEWFKRKSVCPQHPGDD
uniref:RING-type E3 ubiquitin transferase n=1 Tax=Panagrellus redivivus TaxID=6233 RepID=A0A7E4VML0_PANRE